MFDMLLWFAVVMVLFAVGDVVAKLTKARISSVFATLMLFLVLFVTGVLPADIIEKAGLSAASSWSVPMLLFAMGSMINLRQFMDEWRTVVTCWFGMLAVIIGVSLTIPIIGKEMALSAIPVVNGALPATQIMTEAATKAGYPLAAALAAITFAVQKFVGTPFASSASLRPDRRIPEGQIQRHPGRVYGRRGQIRESEQRGKDSVQEDNIGREI